MNLELINSFRKNYEKLIDLRTELETQVKIEATKEISFLISENNFVASQSALEELKNLLDTISIKMDFDDVSQDIVEFKETLEQLKKTGGEKEVKKEKITPVALSEAASKPSVDYIRPPAESKKVVEKSVSNEGGFLSYLVENFPRHKFEVIQAKGNSIELMKKRKKYWLTISNPAFSKEDYFKILDEKCEKKNIGFVCENENEISALKSITEEWAKKSDMHKTKFLHVNFTSKNRLSEKDGEVFQTTAY